MTNPFSYEGTFNNYGIQTVGNPHFDFTVLVLILTNYLKYRKGELSGKDQSVSLYPNYHLDYVDLNPRHPFRCNQLKKKPNPAYYSLVVFKRACFPNNKQKLKFEFNLSNEAQRKAFLLPNSVPSEPYIKGFQFKILNSILYTNSKLLKIGFIADDLCSSWPAT